MCWGTITASGRAGLAPLAKGVRVNSQGYIQILEEKGKLHMDVIGVTRFQKDSTPCQVSKVSLKRFADNNITLLEHWPSNSPNLNFIVNFWSIMKTKVAQ